MKTIKYTQKEKSCVRTHLTHLWAVMLLFMCVSCQTRYVERDIVHHDSIYITAWSVDTLIQRDSIHIRERGDTIEKVIYKYINNVHIRRDTIVQERVDTIAKVVTKVETKTIKKRDWLSCIGSLAVGIVIGFAILFFHKVNKKD